MTTTTEITYYIGGWATQSGAQDVSVILDPDELHVYSWNTVGAGTPEPVWHHRHRVLCTVPVCAVPDSLEEWLRGHESTIRAIADRYLGTEWTGHDHVGRWSDDADERYYDLDAADQIATYWDASEWLGCAPDAVVDAAIAAARRGSSLEEIVEGEVGEAAENANAHLRREDVEKHLRWLLERRREELDDDDDDERSDRLVIAALLGEDVEPER